MSDLFLTSRGLELGPLDDENSKKEDNVVVYVNNVTGTLLRMSVGTKPYVKFRTTDLSGDFQLSTEQIESVVVKYNDSEQTIKFDSYNYTLERSIDQTIVTIEGLHVKEK